MIRPAALVIGFGLTLLAGKAANIVADAGLNRRASSVGVLQLLPPRATARDGGFLSSGVPLPSGGGTLSVGAGDQRQAGEDAALYSDARLGGSRRESVLNAGAGETKTGSPDRLLSALIAVESGGDAQAVSPKGARGPFQFMRPTWDDHADGVPYSRATDPDAARVVAVRYLAWLDRTITKWQGRPASLEQVLASWNGGVGRLRERGFKVENMPAESREFVCKVKRAMEEQHAK